MPSDNVVHALSGAAAGISATVVTYPLQTLSTRAQIESKRAEDAENKKISPLEAARQIIQREGASGLYSGIDSALVGISVTNFIYYFFYEGTRARLGKGRPLSALESMAAGAVAGSATVVLTNPIWVINTRATTSKTEKGLLQVLRKVLNEGGIKALFAGLGPALVLVINPILQYTVFEQLRNLIERRRRMTPRDAFLLGALGKLIATFVTYPIVTLKTRMQVAKKGENYKGLIGSFTDIIKSEGWSGLYSGLETRLLQSVLTAAFLFYFKEEFFSITLQILAFLGAKKASARGALTKNKLTARFVR
ncbi:hypothetical protein CANCADRAFT_2599 [Tortispora caseinolytica NRRL Y-17796]|uniref:Peroxisomal membrane protein PMP47B n=1 Tax=Tortispora caseinolytica NRRL Y-17796 TaxID=767744 RepID=A0A1E4TGP2_9ASCO|nr:hypothetical protein CANCADRAFT_2599 [Tortispora caseinolytica NRRL Y-17796]